MTPCPCCHTVPVTSGMHAIHDQLDPAAFSCPYAAIAVPVASWPPPADPIEAPELFIPKNAKSVRPTPSEKEMLQNLANSCIEYWEAQKRRNPAFGESEEPLFVRLARYYIDP